MSLPKGKFPSVLIWNGGATKEPALSVFIPTYKRADLLKQTLESVFTNKTEGHYEIVIVDNNPERNDATEKMILSEYKRDEIRYYKNTENIGACENWNQGFSLCLAPWIFMIHDDDLMYQNTMVYLFDFIKFFPQATIIHSSFTRFKGTDRPKITKISNKKTLFSQYYYSTIIRFHFLRYLNAGSGALYKKETWIKYHGFDKDTLPACDLDYYVRLLSGKEIVVFFRKSLIYYRISDNDSLNPKTMAGCINREMEEYMKYILPSFHSIIWRKISDSFIFWYLNMRIAVYSKNLIERDKSNDFFLHNINISIPTSSRFEKLFWRYYVSIVRRILYLN